MVGAEGTRWLIVLREPVRQRYLVFGWGWDERAIRRRAVGMRQRMRRRMRRRGAVSLLAGAGAIVVLPYPATGELPLSLEECFDDLPAFVGTRAREGWE